MGAAALPAMLAMQVVGGLVQGKAEQKAGYAAAAADDENARLSLLAGEQDAFRVLRDERQAVGESIAASGSVYGGSLATLVEESARQAELDIFAVRQKAAGEAQSYRDSARDQRRAGDNAFIGGIFNGISTALSGASRAHQGARLREQLGREREVQLGGGYP